MARIAKPRELRIHQRANREVGATSVRLLAGRSSYSGAQFWQVRVGSAGPLTFTTLAEAEQTFAVVSDGGSLERRG